MSDLVCEHCETRLTLIDMPIDAIDAEWRCPNCNKVITEKSWIKARGE